MTLSDYRKAVSGVRWSPQQRTRMEALLSMPAQSPEFLDETEFTLVGEITMKEMNEMKAAEEKRSKRNRKIFLVVLAAALLGTGAAGMAVGFGKTGKTEQSETDIESQIEEQTALGLHLTDQQDDPGARGPAFMSNAPDHDTGWFTENGYYCMRELPVATMDKPYQKTICFVDKETGEIIPLCTNPGCTHDGNLFCTATTEAYSISGIAGYDGYFYALAAKQDNQHQCLLRYEPDGSEIKEVADFGAGLYQESILNRPVIHRGYVWCVVGKTTVSRLRPEEERINFPGFHWYNYEDATGGFELVGYEIATGKTVTLCSFFPEDSETSTDVYDMIPALWGDGDYLYFCYGDYENIYGGGNTRCPEIKEGLNRISLITGKIEQIPTLGRYPVSFAKGYYVFARFSRENAQQDVIHIRRVDSDSDEDVEIPVVIPRNYSEMIHYFTDGDYVYATGQTKFNTKEKRYPYHLWVYDMQGNEKADVTIDLNYFMTGDMFAKDGVIYVDIQEEQEDIAVTNWNNYRVGWRVDDLIAGKTEWSMLFDLGFRGRALFGNEE